MNDAKQYNVRVRNRNGEVFIDTFEASSKNELYTMLAQKHLIAIEIQENLFSRLNLNFSFLSKKQPQKPLRDLFFQLGTYLTSGISLEKVLKISISHQKDKRMSKTLDKIHSDIRSGKSFSESLEKYPDIFPGFICASVYAGEESGQLGKILLNISELIDNQISLKNSFTTAMIYPLILLLTAILSITLITFFAIPKFAQIFEDLDKPMPFVLNLMFQVSSHKMIFAVTLILIVSGLTAFGIYLWHNSKIRHTIESYLIQAPQIGDLIVFFQLALYFKIMGIAIKSSVAVDRAIELSNSTLTSAYIKNYFASILKNIRKGEKFSSCLKEITWIPEVIPALAEVGEESGRMGESSLKISEILSDDLQKRVTILTSFAEPLLILVVSVIIGGIVITLLYSLFSINF